MKRILVGGNMKRILVALIVLLTSVMASAKTPVKPLPDPPASTASYFTFGLPVTSIVISTVTHCGSGRVVNCPYPPVVELATLSLPSAGYYLLNATATFNASSSTDPSSTSVDCWIEPQTANAGQGNAVSAAVAVGSNFNGVTLNLTGIAKPQLVGPYVLSCQAIALGSNGGTLGVFGIMMTATPMGNDLVQQ